MSELSLAIEGSEEYAFNPDGTPNGIGPKKPFGIDILNGYVDLGLILGQLLDAARSPCELDSIMDGFKSKDLVYDD